jgi:DNA-binding transcriptional MerR regulator
MMTIGELARQVGLRTSALRYYEAEGLLAPDGRSEAGYRLYAPEAVQTLRLIQRAQRLGFSLADIKTLLDGWQSGDLSNETLLATAEDRYLSLEKEITELRVEQHELQLFLQDLRARQKHGEDNVQSAFDQLVERVCANPAAEPLSDSVLDWFSDVTGCTLTGPVAESALAQLRGRHVHIWREDESYHILVVSRDPAVADAIQEVARLEAGCDVHEHPMPELIYDDEGYLLIARGDNAFIFARLFLALAGEAPVP